MLIIIKDRKFSSYWVNKVYLSLYGIRWCKGIIFLIYKVCFVWCEFYGVSVLV